MDWIEYLLIQICIDTSETKLKEINFYQNQIVEAYLGSGQTSMMESLSKVVLLQIFNSVLSTLLGWVTRISCNNMLHFWDLLEEYQATLLTLQARTKYLRKALVSM